MQENECENIVCRMIFNLSQPQCGETAPDLAWMTMSSSTTEGRVVTQNSNMRQWDEYGHYTEWGLYQHIEANTKKAAILKTTFHVHFIDWVYLYFDPNVTKVCSWECSWQWQHVSIGLCNGLAPKWWQAITWNIDNPITRRIHATVDINVFKGTVKQNARSVKHLPASVHMGIAKYSLSCCD